MHNILWKLNSSQIVVDREKLMAREVATSYQRDGQPAYLLYEVSPFRPETP